MKRSIADCDFCSAKDISDDTLVAFNIDRKMDAAGSMDDIIEYRDICPKCLKIALIKSLGLLSREQNEEVLRFMQARAKT